ncbi:unnamed protein product, partial [marine sediment metagenome]
MPKRMTKTFGDVMPKLEFHPDLPKRPQAELLDEPYEIVDAMVVKDFESQFGRSDFALLEMVDAKDDSHFTTLAGGLVVVKKVQYAIDHKLFPLYG